MGSVFGYLATVAPYYRADGVDVRRLVYCQNLRGADFAAAFPLYVDAFVSY